MSSETTKSQVFFDLVEEQHLPSQVFLDQVEEHHQEKQSKHQFCLAESKVTLSGKVILMQFVHELQFVEILK